MALAYGNFHYLSQQLRFLLFEIGIGMTESAMNHFITLAHRQCLQRLQHAAIMEGLIDREITSHHVHDFLDLLKIDLKKSNPASAFNRWQDLRNELDETIANQALALAYRQHWQQTLRLHAKKYPSLWSWLCAQHDPSDITQFLEQWGCIGHPYHPNFRAKIGFNRCEVMQYSPEFNALVRIHWAAIHRTITHTSVNKENYRQLLSYHFPDEYQRWAQALHFKRLNPDNYYPLLLHPWQWRNKQHTLGASLQDDKQLILVPHHQNTMPTMSLRTMMSLSNRGPHIKLAVDVHTTSSFRTVSPASIDNGPTVSSWVNHILARHQYYEERLFLAHDLAGINITHPAIPLHEKRQLAMLIRENPLNALKDSQQLVPLAALFAPSPVSQTPLLLEIIETSQINPEECFAAYCAIVLKGQLHLLVHYGIALEAHQQNTLVIFENNQPKGLVIRDLGGIKICTHPIYSKVIKPELHPDSTITCTRLDELSNKFIHGNLQSNLGYWIKCLHAHYGLSSHSLWHQVYQTLQQQFDVLKTKTDQHLHQWHQHQLLSMPWQQKSLLTMRLNREQTIDVYTAIANPLSACS